MQSTEQIAANLEVVRARIDAACARAGRSQDEITLVAVSKTHPVAVIQAAMAAGQRSFGENRVEDAWAKFADPASPSALCHSPYAFDLHLIGPIQSRKAAHAVACRPALIHALDRFRVARRLDHFAALAGVALDVLLEVNVSGEPSKFGFAPESLELAVEEVLGLPWLRMQGLMTMPPYDPDPEAARPYFAQLRALRDRLATRWPGAGWPHLSMGMSHDFEVAIAEGATIVRVGTAIFGERR